MHQVAGKFSNCGVYIVDELLQYYIWIEIFPV